MFWPQELLPDEPEITTARILTFGYNSDFRSTGPNNVSSISDFARQLLNAMKYGKGGDDLNIGKVFTPDPSISFPSRLTFQKPIIFVVHSLGGLVLKKVNPFLIGFSLTPYNTRRT